MLRLIPFILGLIHLIICDSVSSQDWNAPEQGILDLRDISFDEQTYVKLNGEWEFYWKVFLEPEDFTSPDVIEPTLFAKVPSYWTSYEHEDIKFEGTGYASYRLLILLPERRPNEIAFDVPVFDASFSMFLNEHMVHTNGKPGISREESIPGYNPKRIKYKPESDTLQLLINVSNFQHRRGGFWKSMQLGHPLKISRAEQKYKLLSYISLGVLAAFALFFLFFFFFYPEDYLLLSFSLVVTGIFLRLMTTDLYPILLIFDLKWEWLIRFEYLGTFMALAFGMWYFYKLFPVRYMLWVIRINTFVIGLISIIILLFDVRVFAYTMLYLQPVALIILVYYLIICTWNVLKGKTEDILFLTGLVVFIAALLNDISIANSMTAISKNYTIHFAVQLFVFLQAIIIIRSWIRTYREKGRLMMQIEDININLEKRVDERTAELNKRNIEIESRNKELSEALDFKNRVFYIIAHDLKSPVASLVQNSALLDLDLPDVDREKIFTSFREQSRSSLNLIDNLLFWGRSQGSQLAVNPAIYEVKELVKEVLELFSGTARHKSISVEDTYTGNTEAFIDKELIEIVVRNLVSNAIKFSRKGGHLQVHVKKEMNADKLSVMIRDNGVGMSQEQIENVLGGKDLISTPGTENEKGTGLGLRLCYDLMKINKGELSINSQTGRGTEIILQLPVTEISE